MSQIPMIALVVLPFIEIWLMIWVGHWTGGGMVLLALLLSGIIGWQLLRFAGSGMLRAAHACLRRGESPERELLDGAMRMLGAILWIIPGFLSDLFGLLLLFPWMRTLLGVWLLAHWPQTSDPTIIEGEILHKQSHEEPRDVLPG